MPGLLAERSALVTAGGSGSGAASARALAADGAKVTIGDLDAGSAEAVAAAIRAEGGEAVGAHVDARSAESVAALVAKAQNNFGALHIAHLNAGGGPDTGILDGSLERFEASIGINLVSVFVGLQAVAPAIIAAGGGAIVATASQAGFLGQRHIAGYVSAKHGIIGLVKCAAAELAPHNIRVNCVCPSSIYTGIFGGAFADEADADAKIGKHNILGRIGRPREVGEVVAFLASERASFITATAIPVDAGDLGLQSPQFMDEVEALGKHIKGLATRS